MGEDNTVTQYDNKNNTSLQGRENILVVDDEPALLELTCEILSQKNYHVFCAGRAKEALEILEKEHIDLLISDVIMPDMDGYQLAAIVQEKYPNIKIQLASGFSGKDLDKLADKELSRKLLHKPYNSQTLLKRIHALLQ